MSGAAESTPAEVRVGLGWAASGYRGIVPPYDPGVDHPELAPLRLPPARGAENEVYSAVRDALRALDLDAAHFGGPDWNPLGDLVERGGQIALKPNFIRHWNPAVNEGGSIDSVITHGSVVRAVLDYALLAVGESGTVVIAEAPQQDCDFDEIRRITGLDEVVELHAAKNGRHVEVIDLRREAVRFDDGVIAERRTLPGDPLGYREVDLGQQSFFEGSGLDPRRFRGADYDPGPTTFHHSDGRNAYLLSETVLRSDLVVNLPKLKTHKKTGVTLALKNLVGINGDKNWLPHHTLGAPAQGGDEFPQPGWLDRARSRATEWARPLLARGRFTRIFGALRRAEDAARGHDFVRSGNWHGNQTTWRMCCDLNRALYYSDASGLDLDAPQPRRRILTLLDGIVAGEGEGPLAPTDVPLGAVIASEDPIAVDLVALRLMGFEPARVPKVREAMRDPGPRITAVREARQVRVARLEGEVVQRSGLETLPIARRFRPHPGWVGHLEIAE